MRAYRWFRRECDYCPAVLLVLACIVVLQFLLLVTDRHEVFQSEYSDISELSAQKKRDQPINQSHKSTTTEMIDTFKTCTCGLHFNVDEKESLVFPSKQNKKVFLTIGIPTILRKVNNYLIKTIESLISNMAGSDLDDVIIVIFLADIDVDSKKNMSTMIDKKYRKYLQTGLIHVIQAPPQFYSPMNITKRTYDHTPRYVKWRSKQNFDYAYIFKYSMGRSLFYMQIEDDVRTLPGYITSIRNYINEQKGYWTCLEFSELGFIGKLYRSEDLEKLAMMFLLFYQEQPVDSTYLYFNMLMTQMTKRLHKPTLFQHLGIHSSFPGKIQPLKDRYFDNFNKEFKSDNPPAEIITSMSVYLTFLPRLAYQGEGYFWSHGAPTDGDTFTVIFHEPQKLDRVVVITGSEAHLTDRIEHAQLEASLTLVKSSNDLKCTNDIPLGNLVNGKIDAGFLKDKINFKVMCLRLTITKKHVSWVIVREFAVFICKTK